jgi:hypothetical protein
MTQATTPRPQVKTVKRQVAAQVTTLMLNVITRKASNHNPNAKYQNPYDTSHSESTPKSHPQCYNAHPQTRSRRYMVSSRSPDRGPNSQPRLQVTAPAPSQSPQVPRHNPKLIYSSDEYVVGYTYKPMQLQPVLVDHVLNLHFTRLQVRTSGAIAATQTNIPLMPTTRYCPTLTSPLVAQKNNVWCLMC